MKKIFVLFFALMFFVAPSIKVDAAVNYPTIPIDKEFSQYVIFNGQLVTFPKTTSVQMDSSGVGLFFSSTFKTYFLRDGEWVYQSTYAKGEYSTIKLSQIEYSSVDIYVRDSLEVIFAKKNVPALVLPPAFQGVEMGAAMKIVLEVTPIVVLSIVSFLGLRKALNFCLLQLRES